MSVHPTALVSPEVEMAPEVEIGPFAVVEGNVRLAAGVRIGGHARVCGEVWIGERTEVGWGSVIGADPQDTAFDRSVVSGVRIGAANQIREYVTIHRGAKPGSFTEVGQGNFLMTGVHLAHDVSLGDHKILANNVLLAGHVQVANRAFLGGGAVFHPFLRLGELAMVQGNAAISQDVAPYCMVHGYNRLAGLNTIGLRRAGFSAAARAEIKRAFHFLFREGIPLRRIAERAAGGEWSEEARVLIDAVAHPSAKGGSPAKMAVCLCYQAACTRAKGGSEESRCRRCSVIVA